MKDSFLYLAPVANCAPLPFIKQSSIGNVPVETITTSTTLIYPETPWYKHCTQRLCTEARRCPKNDQNRMEAFIMNFSHCPNFLPGEGICFLFQQACVFACIGNVLVIAFFSKYICESLLFSCFTHFVKTSSLQFFNINFPPVF